MFAACIIMSYQTSVHTIMIVLGKKCNYITDMLHYTRMLIHVHTVMYALHIFCKASLIPLKYDNICFIKNCFKNVAWKFMLK